MHKKADLNDRLFCAWLVLVKVSRRQLELNA